MFLRMRVTRLFARNMTKVLSMLLEKRTENPSIEHTAPVSKRKLPVVDISSYFLEQAENRSSVVPTMGFIV